MKDKKKLLILMGIITGVLVLTLGLTYAAFTYNKTGETSKLVLGDIYMKYTENNQLTLSDAMPMNINKYITYKVNPIMKEQSIGENELSKCVSYVKHKELVSDLAEGSTLESYCKGTGTINDTPFSFVLFVSTNNLGGPYDQTDISFFEENNIILLQEDGSYIVNPIMANQSLNELTSCVSFLTSVEMPLTDGQTMENFCKGTGTASNGYTFQENLNNDDFFSEEVLTYFEENNIITSKIENLPYFEFTISGKNTYEKEDIWYDVVLMHGDEHATRTTRIRDDLLKFALVEVGNNEEKIIFSNRFYENLNNKRIHVETIKANTLDVVNKTYRLYMWIDENTIIGNVNQDYTMEEWEDVFASIKVGVTGDFVEKFIYTEERCFEYLPNIYSDDQIIGVSIINYDETCGSDVVIPKTIDGYNVMVINSEAFGSKNKGKGLTSVVIPDSVGEIGYYAFANNKLTSIKLSDNLYFIDESAFAANQLTSVEIPDNVYTIGKFAFGSNLLEKVTIGKNVNDIGEGAFGINFGYGMYDNPINTIVNKSGNVFDWNAVLGIGVYADSDNTFATGTIKYNGPYGETEILVTSE